MKASFDGNCLIRIARRLKNRNKTRKNEECRKCGNPLINESVGYLFCVNCVSKRLSIFIHKTQTSKKGEKYLINPFLKVSEIAEKYYGNPGLGHFSTEKLQRVHAFNPEVKFVSVAGAIHMKIYDTHRKWREYGQKLTEYLWKKYPVEVANLPPGTIINCFFKDKDKDFTVNFLKAFEKENL